MKYYNIGGQAVIEGVMMRNKNNYALAVRNVNGEIQLEKNTIKKISNSKIFKLPIIRGIVAFLDSLFLGTKLLTRSAELAGIDEEEPSAFEKYIENKFGDKLNKVLIFLSVSLAMIIGTALFMLLPVAITSLIGHLLVIPSLTVSFLEGIVRLIVFLIYIKLISKNKDIQRVFMYHGAEHKCINCYEDDTPLTVQNVKKYPTLHKRCGTSFLLIVMIVSSIFFMFLKTDEIYLRVVTRLFFLPLVGGFSYEILKISSRSSNPILNFLIAPGLKLQKLTTLEPDDLQIEVAIKSMEAVLPKNE